jgi:cytochrome P450
LLERWRTELVEVVVHELIDRFAPRGYADLVREFTFAFPVQVIARLMGLPREDYVRLQQLSIELLSVVYNWDIGMAASATLKEYFGEIFAFLLLILPAGVETTAFRSPAALPVEITAA